MYLLKPLQGMAFQTMQAELVNCPVNYEDPPEEKVGHDMMETTRWKMGQSIFTSPKKATWKSVIATPFKTPHECVGHSRARISKILTGRRIRRTTHNGTRICKIPMDRPTDRRIGRTTYSRGLVRLGNRFLKRRGRELESKGSHFSMLI